MNQEKLRLRHPLSNGLTLDLWDQSRPVAGDRWYAALEVRIKVAVTGANLPPELAAKAKEALAALGPEVVFSQKDERNFIAHRELPEVLKEMEARALKLAAGYFGHPDFARRLIRLRYARHLESRGLPGG
jgi:hypothetical protein